MCQKPDNSHISFSPEFVKRVTDLFRGGLTTHEIAGWISRARGEPVSESIIYNALAQRARRTIE